jgi:hypothetical protein
MIIEMLRYVGKNIAIYVMKLGRFNFILQCLFIITLIYIRIVKNMIITTIKQQIINKQLWKLLILEQTNKLGRFVIQKTRCFSYCHALLKIINCGSI